MTTVAYKDGIIAADTLINSGGVVENTKFDKLILQSYSDGWVCYAFSGRVSDISKAIYYIRQEDTVDKTFDSFYAIKVYKAKSGELIISKAENNLFFWDIPNEPAVLGSGYEIALTAMDLGVSSIDAVKQAMKRDLYTGGNITYVDFNKESPSVETIMLSGD